MDGDENKVLDAAHLIVQSLAGSLALVTSREPLRMSLLNHIREKFQNNPNIPSEVVEHLVNTCAKDNLDFGCSIIQKAVTDKALRKVSDDPTIKKALDLRRSCRDHNIKFPPEENQNKYMQKLPHLLRHNTSGLTDEQFNVYQDFAKLLNKSILQTTPTLPQAANPRERMNMQQQQPIIMGEEPNIPKASLNPLNTQKQNQTQTQTQTQAQAQMQGQGPPEYRPEERQRSVSPKAKHNNSVSMIESLGMIQNLLSSHQVPNRESILPYLHRFKQELQECDQNDKIIISCLREIFESLYNCEIPQTNTQNNHLAVENESEPVDEKTIHNRLEIYLELILLIRIIYPQLPSKINELIWQTIPNVKFNIYVLTFLFRNSLINIQDFDMAMAVFLQTSLQNQAILTPNLFQFLSFFILNFIAGENLIGISQIPQIYATLGQLVKLNDPSLSKYQNEFSKLWNALELEFKTKAGELFEEWASLSRGNPPKDEINIFFSHLQKLGIYTNESLFMEFFMHATEIAVKHALFTFDGSSTSSGESSDSNNEQIKRNYKDRLDYRWMDSLSKFIFIILTTQSSEHLNKILRSICTVLIRDHAINNLQFNQRPYYRLLMSLNVGMKYSDFNYSTLIQFAFLMADAFHALNPSVCPGFAYAWLELISHNRFMPILLAQNNPNFKNEPPLQDPAYAVQIQFMKSEKMMILVLDMFKFLHETLTDPMSESVRTYCEAIMRVCLVILIDFPEFFSNYHFNFIHALPETCIQLKNIILTAISSTMHPPDPFKIQDLKSIESLPQMKNPPTILSDYKQYLSYMNLKDDFEKYAATKNMKYIIDVCNKLILVKTQTSSANRLLINAIVLYLAELTLNNGKNNSMEDENCYQLTRSECTDVFDKILERVDTPTADIFLNSIVNELRFPNSYMLYFSNLILHIFETSSKQIIQEQITR